MIRSVNLLSKSIGILTLVGLLLAGCGQTQMPTSKEEEIPSSAQGYTLDVRGGTANFDSSFFSPIFSSTQSAEDQVRLAAKTQTLQERFGLVVNPQDTAQVAVNLYISVLKDGIAPSTPTTFSVTGFTGNRTLEANQAWTILPSLEILSADPEKNRYVVNATNQNVRLRNSVTVNASRSANLLPIPQNLKVAGSKGTLLASWVTVAGAKSYIALLYDRDQRKVIWSNTSTSTKIEAVGIEGIDTNFPARYELSVLALSFEAGLSPQQPFPNPTSATFNTSAAARFVTVNPSNFSAPTAQSLIFSGQPGDTISRSTRIQIGFGPLSYTLTPPSNNALRLSSPSSITGILPSNSNLEIQVQATCPANETTVFDNLILTTNSDQSTLNIPIVLECRRPISASRTLWLPNPNNASQVAWSPDGSKIVTASNPLILWNSQTGTPLISITPPLVGPPINDLRQKILSWNSDGSRVAYANGVNVSLLEATTGRTLFVIDGLERMDLVAWNPDNSRIVVSGRCDLGVFRTDNGSRIWSNRTPCTSTNAGYTNQSVAWSPNGSTVAVSSSVSTASGITEEARIYNSSDGVLQRTISNVLGPISFITNEQIIGFGLNVSGGADSIGVWNTTSGTRVRTLGTVEGIPYDLSISQNNSRLALVESQSRGNSSPSRIRMYDFVTGNQLWTLPLESTADSGNEPSIALNPSGSQLVVSTFNQSWDSPSVFILNTSNGTLARGLGYQRGQFSSLEFSPDNSTLVSTTEQGSLRSYNLTFGPQLNITTTSRFFSTQWMGNSNRIATLSDPTGLPLIRTLNTQTGNWITSQPLAPSLDRIAWNPAGTRLVYTPNGLFTQSTWRIASSETGQIVASIQGGGSYWFVTWNSDSTQLAGINQNGIDIFDPTNGNRIRSISFIGPAPSESSSWVRLIWPSDGRFILIGRSNVLAYSPTGQFLLDQTFPSLGTFGSLSAVSPDGSRVAFANVNQIIVGSTVSGATLLTIPRADTSREANSMAWSTNNAYLATGATDNLEVYRITPQP